MQKQNVPVTEVGSVTYQARGKSGVFKQKHETAAVAVFFAFSSEDAP